MVRVAIRDDDLNYYTTIEEIQKAYKDIIGNIPVGFAVIPFVHKSHFLFADTFIDMSRSEQLLKLSQYESDLNKEEYEQYMNLGYIDKNKELTAYVKNLMQNEQVEIYLHGITHRFYPDGAEFSGDHISIQDIKLAKKYMEKVFDNNIKYFVPPSNTLSYKNMKKIIENDLNILLSGSILTENKIEKAKYGFQLLKNNPFLDVLKRRKKRMGKYKLTKNKEFLNCFTFKENDTVLSFINRNSLTENLPEKIIIATHYTNHLNKNCWSNFKELIEYLKEKGAIFVKCSEL